MAGIAGGMKLNKKFGNRGEQKAGLILTNLGFEIQSPDWVAIKNNKIMFVEVKEKNKRFKNEVIEGHGLDIKQIEKRQHLFNVTGIRTYLLIFDNTTNEIFVNYIDELEMGEYYDTRNGIRIYPIKNYEQVYSIV